MDDRNTRDSLADMLDGLGRSLDTAPVRGLAPGVVGAMRRRRRSRAFRVLGAAAAATLVLTIGASWLGGLLSTPPAPVPARISHDPPRPAPVEHHRPTVGYLTAAAEFGRDGLRLPETGPEVDAVPPLGPANAAEMLRGL